MPGLTTKIIRIGNSQGIRIPKTILEQCHLGTEVILEPGEDRLVVRRGGQGLRAGWDEAFRRMAREADDVLLDAESVHPTEWDEAEWSW
jgi:antitoxin MazE